MTAPDTSAKKNAFHDLIPDFREEGTANAPHPRKKAGFTLIELLVVMGIIALLGSFAAARFGDVRARARDAEREQTMKTLQNAFALWANSFSRYPPSTGDFPYASAPLTGEDQVSHDLLAAETLYTIPQDPLNTGNFVYRYESPNGSRYTITYYLETDSIPGKSPGVQFAGP